MTEGIIDKVIDEFINQNWLFKDWNYTTLDRDDIIKMKQKLIQEIDKASRLYGCTCWIETAALIGDKE